MARGCVLFQKHTAIPRVLVVEIHFVVKPSPFRVWAMDTIGGIHPMSFRGFTYVLVAINYFTKWVEVIHLKNVTQDNMIEFMKEHIIFCFGLP